MRELVGQFATIWRESRPVQKIFGLSVFCLATGFLAFLLFRSPASDFVSLFEKEEGNILERSEIRTFLHHLDIPYKDGGEKGFLVPKKLRAKARQELAGGQGEVKKGFELFDTNTWIKGEKELQVLEMRALKGQLERDLTGFDSIKSASVILDLAPPRSFSGPQYKTKASVILTLMPGVLLSTSQLHAITYHLAGAVRGLESNMIAISDTTGKLYKALDPDGVEESISHGQLALEEHIEQKATSLLKKLLGEDHFYVVVSAQLNRKNEEILSLSIGAILDRNFLGELVNEDFKQEIVRQLEAIGRGYGYPVEPVVDLLPFEKKKKMWSETPEKVGYTGLFYPLLFVVAALISFLFLFVRFQKKKLGSDEEETLFSVMTRVDLGKLADSIREEDPATIAHMLSYLEPRRAKALMERFPQTFQDEVIYHLAELEQELD
ncbi:MAG: Flagellar M-ring protein [Chlamydiae bacterium]|nr:Flagellar M-ring protein [Chlamydiota bacterium]